MLAAGLVERGRSVESVALADEGAGLEVPALGASRLGLPTLRRLRRRMEDDRIVVGFGSSTLPACAAAGLGTHSHFVYRSIGEPLYWCNTPARRWRTSLALRRAQRVVALWDGAAASFRDVLGVAADKLTTIPNCVDDARFTPADGARREAARTRFGLRRKASTVLYLGSLTAEKRVGLAIAAVGRVEDAQLLIAGDGPLRDELEKEAAVLDGRCKFAGVVDAEDALAAADVLVLPSLSEGMPAAVLEAAFAGVPAVVTDVGALGEIVRDGHSGRVLPVALDATVLGAALGEVLEVAEPYGAAARAHCTGRYDLETVTATWVGFLDNLTYP